MSKRTPKPREHYVHVFHRWVTQPQGHWTISAGVADPADATTTPTDTTIAIYEVSHCARTDAVATVLGWLAQGRPSAMTVSALFEKVDR